MYLAEAHAISRDNNINLIRLFAAASVTFYHSFALLNLNPVWNEFASIEHFGGVAVAVFFGLSGFLIAQSFERRKSWFQFLEARWLRIFPGYFFACLVTTILISQFVKNQGFSAFLDIKNWRYTFGAFFFDTPYFNGVFEGLPSSGVNGSVWTLPIEFRMYLFVFVFGLAGILQRRFLFLFLMVCLLFGTIAHVDFVTNKLFYILFSFRIMLWSYLMLPLSFVVGVIFYLFREKILLSPLAAIALLLSNLFITNGVLIVLAYLYAAFVFGFYPKFYLDRLNFKTDLSYGIYVLSFPIQQTLIFNNIKFEAHVFFLFAMLFILPLAYVSWAFIEKPALALKGKRIRFSSFPFRRAELGPTTSLL